GVHLIDPSTGEYNRPFLEAYGVSGLAILLRGYVRVQGIMVAPGNPKGIGGLSDLLGGDVRIVNRNPGSGTRVLLDLLIEREAERRGVSLEELRRSISGYEICVSSHGAVAAAVASGRADAGLGIEAAARAYGLDFIPLAEERYDFLVRRDRLGKREVSLLVEILRSEEFREALEEIPGIRPSDGMGEPVP
ncbi:MAG: molybdopterin biosynthesis protein, partial [Thermoproteota archaeon]